MIITILQDKYRCGSHLGYSAIDEKGLIGKLNSVIDWKFCTFPKKLKEGGDRKKDDDWIEDREFLGAEPKLVPGNMFIYDGQVIAVDQDDRLVLCVTETGAWAIMRFKDTILKNELLLRDKDDFQTSDVTCSEIEKPEDGKFEAEYIVPYYLMKIWREHVLPGRFKEENLNLKIQFTSEDHIFPVELIIQDWKIKYNNEFVPEDMMERTALEALTWTYNNFEKIK